MNPIVITGATGSMGAVVAETLARDGKPLILACRNLKKGEVLLENLRSKVEGCCVELMELDLSRQSSVKSFVESLDGRKLAGLFNNAGTMARRYSKTEDGLETDMAVNFVNTALLTRSLVPMIEDGGRIVNMVSVTTKISSLSADWQKDGEKEFGQLKTYGKSKLALLYFSIALARKTPRLYVNVSDPGVVNSKMITMDRWFDPIADVLFRPFINSPEKGVRPALAALEANDSLRYYVGKHNNLIPERFLKSEMADVLWGQL